MNKKIVPFVTVMCCRCGEVAEGSGFYYRGIIAAIDKATKDWIYSEEIAGVLCPKCKKGEKDGNK